MLVYQFIRSSYFTQQRRSKSIAISPNWDELVNDAMPAYCVREAVKLLDGKKKNEDKSLDRVTVTLLGLAFRGGVSDTRLSPTYEVIKEFQKIGVKEIRVHDPLVKSDPLLLKHQNVILSSDLTSVLNGTDLIMIVADHAEYRALTPIVSEGYRSTTDVAF